MLAKLRFIVSFLFICYLVPAQTDSLSTTTAAEPVKDTLPQKQKQKQKSKPEEPPALGEVFKPKISFGVGMLSFNGDLYAKHFQAPWTARVGYDLSISQRLFKPLELNFNVLFGKLGANEWLNNRQENFQSEIRSGGISLLYDFGNFIPDRFRVRPWISLGVNSVEFLSKTDRYDRYGNKYYYWTDGSIKNIDQSAPTASLAVNLTRDYVYETDIRESNKDGFGKYQERTWAFPVGAGALMKLTDRFDLKLGIQYYFTMTDYIDGITKNSLGTRAGTKQRDNFVYTSFALQYDLVTKKKSKMDVPEDHFDDVDVLALDNGDYDEDGVRDWDDKCHGTPKGVKIDAFGCPFDDDHDGVPNHEDKELQTPAGLAVNIVGVGLTDEYWQDWYDHYMDSGNVAPKTEILDNFYASRRDSMKNASALAARNEKSYTVELARYSGPVPNDEMSNLLSIGDVKSTVLSDNTTVLYTAGSYKEIQNAVKRKDEFIAGGNKNAKIGYYKDGNFTPLTDEEVNAIIEGNTKTNNLATNTSTSTTTNRSGKPEETVDNTDAGANEFEKGDIVFRVQLGAYRNRISKGIFKNVGGNILELKTDDNYYRYTTKGFKTIGGAASLRADLVLEGYGDAFITAYKDGKRIPLSATKATMDTKEKENLNESASFSSVDKSLITFKVQLGALRKAEGNNMEEKTKDIADLEKQATGSGSIRYTAGSFKDYAKADAYRQELADKGFSEAFVIAVFKGDVISIQEAQELLK